LPDDAPNDRKATARQQDNDEAFVAGGHGL
jgi:hypothetical protein